MGLTKVLSYAIAPDIQGKWLFGQIRFEAPPPEASQGLSIEQVQMLVGRLTTNRIFVGDQAIGEIRFIVGQP